MGIPRELFHGSPHAGLTALTPLHASSICCFGPAVYLTDDLAVAGCYTRRSGSVYTVHLHGEPDCALDLNRPCGGQGQRLLGKVAWACRHVRQPFDPSIVARDIIHPPACDMAAVNQALKIAGVWMIFGRLDLYEVSGLMDRGIQYAVVDEDRITVVHEARDAMRPVSAGGGMAQGR